MLDSETHRMNSPIEDLMSVFAQDAGAPPSVIAPMAEGVLDLRLKRQKQLDRVFREITRFFALCVFLLLISIVVSLAVGSYPAIKAFGWSFLTTAKWNPVTQQFGGLVPV